MYNEQYRYPSCQSFTAQRRQRIAWRQRVGRVTFLLEEFQAVIDGPELKKLWKTTPDTKLMFSGWGYCLIEPCHLLLSLYQHIFTFCLPNTISYLITFLFLSLLPHLLLTSTCFQFCSTRTVTSLHCSPIVQCTSHVKDYFLRRVMQRPTYLKWLTNTEWLYYLCLIDSYIDNSRILNQLLSSQEHIKTGAVVLFSWSTSWLLMFLLHYFSGLSLGIKDKFKYWLFREDFWSFILPATVLISDLNKIE